MNTASEYKFEKIQTLSATEAVAQQLLDMIKSGVLKPGDRLPSEEELCTAFGVGRSSVREAKRLLAAKNILENISGRGTFVCEKLVEDVLSKKTLHRLLADKTKSSLQEARWMLEIRSVELAVKVFDLACKSLLAEGLVLK